MTNRDFCTLMVPEKITNNIIAGQLVHFLPSFNDHLDPDNKKT